MTSGLERSTGLVVLFEFREFSNNHQALNPCLTLLVMHRTESYDRMDPVGVDPRWDAFGPFHDYLLKAFPLV